MTFYRFLLALCLLALPLCAAADDEAQVYTIKKGDTLWGISQRFLSDPYYWPNLWANNPFVGNPHLIYPGQKIAIIDGRIQILPAEAEVPAPKAAVQPQAPAPEPPAPEPVPAVMINALGGATGFINTEDLKTAGTLVDTVDNRILMAAGDKVFVKMADMDEVRKGAVYTVIDPGTEVFHPTSGELAGYQIMELGTLEVIDTNPTVATAVITYASREVVRGARLIPLRQPVKEVALKKAARELNGVLLTANDDKIALGQHDVIYVDLGSADGLEAGNMLYISRPRQATELGLQQEDIRLPDVLLGSAVVLDTRPHTASALVLKLADAVFRGDRVFTVTGEAP